MSNLDLTLAIENVNVSHALSNWSWLLNHTLRPIFTSKFGDWFFFNTSGGVEMLDMIEGQLTPIASSSDEFNSLSKSPDKQSDWFLDGWVYRLNNEQKLLSAGQCYGFNVHPILGGKFEAPNIGIYDLEIYNSLCGQLHRQLRGIA